MGKECSKCGHSHAALGVKIVGAVLIRRARSSRHLLRIAGGAWGFVSSLLDAHPEVRFVEVEDVDSGAVYFCSMEVLRRRSFRRDLGQGEQIVVPLAAWEIGEAARSA